MEFLSEYGMFLAKAVTVVVAILAAVGGLVAISARGQIKPKDHIEIKNINRHYEDMAHALSSAMQSKKQFKQTLKKLKKQRKDKDKEDKTEKRRVFVLNFHGDIRASAVSSLREEVTAVLKVARPEDEVVLRLESVGGLVHGYGLAASQLMRIRDKKLKLTVAVDKVAASGGYMMASVADHIVAAPFAVVGSIGVLAQLPNFHRLLKKHDVDYEMFTAGEFKRTVTILGENTDKGREKFRQDIEDTHELFKDFVVQQRSDLDIAKVATGEHWYGTRALDLKLVDELRTSDDYLLAASENADIFEISYVSKKPLIAKWLSSAAQFLERRYQETVLFRGDF